MHFLAQNYFHAGLNNLFALNGWEMEEGQTLSQFSLTFDKEGWGETAGLISHNAPIEGSDFSLRGKAPQKGGSHLVLSAKGQGALDLMEKSIQARFAYQPLMSVKITFPHHGGWGGLQRCRECQDNVLTFGSARTRRGSLSHSSVRTPCGSVWFNSLLFI